jgi:hypothetical protein
LTRTGADIIVPTRSIGTVAVLIVHQKRLSRTDRIEHPLREGGMVSDLLRFRRGRCDLRCRITGSPQRRRFGAALCAAGFRSSAAADDPVAVAGNGTAVSNTEEPAVVQSKDSPDKRHEIVYKVRNLALAMINYEAKHGHFPPAVIIGPDGKTPHSWRVELLPFLDQNQLYDQYRMSEPWDSPHNQLILKQMPDVFRSPYADPKSTNSACYVFVGPGTAFEKPEGTKLSDITDGIANTVTVVEAKRNVPWTKPEDIPFDPEKPLPAVGGFEEGHFSAGFGDAHAVRFNTEKIKDQVKWLILRNDGHQIQWRGIGD